MAKGNLFLGQAKGKVGSVVFSRAFGQQITRTKPTSVRNPKSYAQNVQRAILATIAKEAALLTPIVDHSFANVTYGAESVRHFRKVNMGILRTMFIGGSTNMNLSAKGAGAVPNALKVSEGNLPAFSSAYQDDQIGFYMNGALSTITETTVEEFKQNYPYIQGGDQLTIVKLVKTSGSLEDGDAVFALKVNRMVFAPNAFDDPEAQILADDGFFNSNLLDLTKTTDPNCLQGVDAGAGKGIGCTTDADNTYAAALILSRKVNNVWQRSTQYLEMCEYDDWSDIATAIESYGATSSLANETEYLNQADESVPVSGTNGAYMNATTKVGAAAASLVQINAGSSQTLPIAAASGTIVNISGQAFAPTGTRVVTVEVDRPDGSYAAHGASSVNYQVALSEQTAGNWKLTALFSDGSRAEYTMTLSVQA